MPDFGVPDEDGFFAGFDSLEGFVSAGFDSLGFDSPLFDSLEEPPELSPPFDSPEFFESLPLDSGAAFR
ncbi:MAG TPA: hypothetical protein VGH98_14830 [Gemmatimonadaceae bacterium]